MGKGPRNINPVSILVVLTIVGAIYGAVKFVPVYLNNNKVDTILADAKHEAAQIDAFDMGDSRNRLLQDIRDKIVELGIDGDYLNVYFADDLTYIYAEYKVVVQHPFGKTTTLEFTRSMEVPRD